MAWFDSLNTDLKDARNAVLADNWWIVALRGVLAIVFGIAAFAVPGATILALVLLFAVYSFVDGIFSIAMAVRGASRRERWGMLLLNGLLGVATGVVAVLWPGITALVFVYIIAAWALISGALMLAAAINLNIDHGRWLLVFGAIVSVIYGILLFVSPLVGALVLTWWLGAYAVVFGVTLIALAFQLRTHRGEHHMHGGAAAAG